MQVRLKISVLSYDTRKTALTHAHAVRVSCRKGSSSSCKVKVLPTPGYSAGAVVRVWNGLSVSKITDKNSCPDGYKIWSPRNKNDWEIVWKALGNDINQRAFRYLKIP